MHDDELREALRVMAEGGDLSGRSARGSWAAVHLVEQVGRRRRQRAVGAALGAMIAVALIVLISVSAASGPVSRPAPAQSPSIDMTPETPTSPTHSVPRPPECDLGVDVGLSRWAPNRDAATPEEAVGGWALRGERLQSVADGNRASTAFVGRGGVRMVAELKHEDDGWYARSLIACVDVDDVSVIFYRDRNSTQSCGPIVRWRGRTYVASVGEPALGPGSLLGDAEIPRCASLPTPDDELHSVRGVVRPVSAYSYSEVSENDWIVLVIDGRPVGYADVTEESGRVAVPSHCGVSAVSLNGRLWLADPPLGGHNPPAGWDENETLGYLVVTRPDVAEFYGDGGQRAHFRLAPAGTTPPGAGCE